MRNFAELLRFHETDRDMDIQKIADMYNANVRKIRV